MDAERGDEMIEVTYLRHMGCDLDVANDAKISFAREAKVFGGKEAKLLSFLAEHNHWSPFSHSVVTFQIKAPIAVARQCFKSKVGFSDTDPDLEPMFAENEESRRYIDSPPTFYDQVAWRTRPTDGAKQGSGGPASQGDALVAQGILLDIQTRSAHAYETLLKMNIAPEQARFALVQSAETEWRWTGSLAAWARFCHLRLAPDAQGETRVIAELVANKMADLFPVSWAALAGWRA